MICPPSTVKWAKSSVSLSRSLALSTATRSPTVASSPTAAAAATNHAPLFALFSHYGLLPLSLCLSSLMCLIMFD
jgi:hypothetical protein